MSNVLLEIPALGRPLEPTNGIQTIEMPKAGELSLEGQQLVIKLLGTVSSGLPDHIEKNFLRTGYLDWRLMVEGKGEYVGSLAKRLSKIVYKTLCIPLSQEVMGKIGEIITKHSDTRTVHFDIVGPPFNWTDGEFGDKGSCYWGTHAKFKKWLEDYGGLAVRRYKNAKGGGVARCWLTPAYGMFVIYNAYNSALASHARLLSHYSGLPYIRVNLVNSYQSAYINGNGLAYLLGPPDRIAQYDYGTGSVYHHPHHFPLPIPNPTITELAGQVN